MAQRRIILRCAYAPRHSTARISSIGTQRMQARAARFSMVGRVSPRCHYDPETESNIDPNAYVGSLDIADRQALPAPQGYNVLSGVLHVNHWNQHREILLWILVYKMKTARSRRNGRLHGVPHYRLKAWPVVLPFRTPKDAPFFLERALRFRFASFFRYSAVMVQAPFLQYLHGIVPQGYGFVISLSV